MRINGVCTGRNASSYKTWIDIETISQDVNTNSSLVNVKEYVQCTDFSNSAYNLNNNNYRYINADNQNRGSNGAIDTRNYKLVLLKDETFPIQHNINGSKEIYIESGFFINGTSSLSSGKISGNYRLNTIPRASICTFSDLILDDDLYINTNRSSSNFYHTIDLYIANVKILTRTEVAQDIIIKMSDDEVNRVYELMKNTSSAELRIVCVTYDNGQTIGTTETRKICHIDKEKNKADYISGNLLYYYGNLLDTHYGPTENVRGRTRVSITGFDFIAKNHATIKKLIMKIGTNVIVESEYQLNDIQNIGGVYTPTDEEARMSLTAIDSRGIESTVYYFLPDSEYVIPQLISAKTRRKNGVEAETYLDLEFRYTQAKNDIESSRSPSLLSVTYLISDENRIQDITEEVKNGIFTIEKETSQYEIGVLRVENIQVHNEEAGGFPVGQSFTIPISIKIGSQQDLQTVWDELNFNVEVNDGKFLDASYKDSSGNYHSGYHTLPNDNYSHNFEGDVNFKDKLFVAGKDILEDTGWIKLNNEVKYRKVSNIVYVCGVSSGTVTVGSNNYVTVGTLPAGYRPDTSFMLVYSAYGQPVGNPSGWIYGDGTIQLYNSTVPTAFWGFFVSYPV